MPDNRRKTRSSRRDEDNRQAPRTPGKSQRRSNHSSPKNAKNRTPDSQALTKQHVATMIREALNAAPQASQTSSKKKVSISAPSSPKKGRVKFKFCRRSAHFPFCLSGNRLKWLKKISFIAYPRRSGKIARAYTDRLKCEPDPKTSFSDKQDPAASKTSKTRRKSSSGDDSGEFGNFTGFGNFAEGNRGIVSGSENDAALQIDPDPFNISKPGKKIQGPETSVPFSENSWEGPSDNNRFTLLINYEMAGQFYPTEWQGVKWNGHFLVDCSLGRLKSALAALRIPTRKVAPLPSNLEGKPNNQRIIGLQIPDPSYAFRFILFFSEALATHSGFKRFNNAPLITLSYVLREDKWIFNPPDAATVTEFCQQVMTQNDLLNMSLNNWSIKGSETKQSLASLTDFRLVSRSWGIGSEAQRSYHKEHSLEYTINFKPANQTSFSERKKHLAKRLQYAYNTDLGKWSPDDIEAHYRAKIEEDAARPAAYGSKKRPLTQKEREEIEEYEARFKKQKTEHGNVENMVVDNNAAQLNSTTMETLKSFSATINQNQAVLKDHQEGLKKLWEIGTDNLRFAVTKANELSELNLPSMVEEVCSLQTSVQNFQPLFTETKQLRSDVNQIQEAFKVGVDGKPLLETVVELEKCKEDFQTSFEDFKKNLYEPLEAVFNTMAEISSFTPQNKIKMNNKLNILNKALVSEAKKRKNSLTVNSEQKKQIADRKFAKANLSKSQPAAQQSQQQPNANFSSSQPQAVEPIEGHRESEIPSALSDNPANDSGTTAWGTGSWNSSDDQNISGTIPVQPDPELDTQDLGNLAAIELNSSTNFKPEIVQSSPIKNPFNTTEVLNRTAAQQQVARSVIKKVDAASVKETLDVDNDLSNIKPLKLAPLDSIKPESSNGKNVSVKSFQDIIASCAAGETGNDVSKQILDISSSDNEITFQRKTLHAHTLDHLDKNPMVKKNFKFVKNTNDKSDMSTQASRRLFEVKNCLNKKDLEAKIQLWRGLTFGFAPQILTALKRWRASPTEAQQKYILSTELSKKELKVAIDDMSELVKVLDKPDTLAECLLLAPNVADMWLPRTSEKIFGSIVDLANKANWMYTAALQVKALKIALVNKSFKVIVGPLRREIFEIPAPYSAKFNYLKMAVDLMEPVPTGGTDDNTSKEVCRQSSSTIIFPSCTASVLSSDVFLSNTDFNVTLNEEIGQNNISMKGQDSLTLMDKNTCPKNAALLSQNDTYFLFPSVSSDQIHESRYENHENLSFDIHHEPGINDHDLTGDSHAIIEAFHHHTNSRNLSESSLNSLIKKAEEDLLELMDGDEDSDNFRLTQRCNHLLRCIDTENWESLFRHNEIQKYKDLLTKVLAINPGDKNLESLVNNPDLKKQISVLWGQNNTCYEHRGVVYDFSNSKNAALLKMVEKFNVLNKIKYVLPRDNNEIILARVQSPERLKKTDAEKHHQNQKIEDKRNLHVLTSELMVKKDTDLVGLTIPEEFRNPKNLPLMTFNDDMIETNKKAAQLQKEADHNNDTIKLARKPGLIITVNLGTITPHKLLLLTKTLPGYIFYCINECFALDAALLDGSLIPSNYLFAKSEPDKEGKVYSLIMWRQEFNDMVKVKPGLGTFSRIIITDGPRSLELVNTYRLQTSSSRYKKGFQETHKVYWTWLNKIVSEASDSCILVGDFNIDKSRKNTGVESENAAQLENSLTDYKSVLKGVTFIKGKCRSAIDHAYVKNFNIEHCKILNMRAAMNSDGHLGFEIKIDMDFSDKEEMFVTFSRPRLEPEEITNKMAVCTDMFYDIIKGCAADNFVAGEDVLRLLETWTQAVMPREVKLKKVRIFRPMLSSDTLAASNILHSLYSWRDTKVQEIKNAKTSEKVKNKKTRKEIRVLKLELSKIAQAIKNVKQKYNSLRREDWLKFERSCQDDVFSNTNDLWKLHAKINKNKIKNKFSESADVIADRLAALQNIAKERPRVDIDESILYIPRVEYHSRFHFGTELLDNQERFIGWFISKLRTVKPFTEGADGLNRYVIQNFPSTMKTAVSFPIAASLHSGIYYPHWSQNRLIPLKKPNNRGIRPITVQNVIGNITEKFVSDRFLEFLELNDLLTDAQHGFRPGHSCGTCIAELELSLAMKSKDHAALLILVDFKNAFGLLLHKLFLAITKHIMQEKPYEWTKGYFENRHFIVELNGQKSSPRPLPPAGVPQGGAPSAIFWSYYINDLPDYFSDDFKVNIFADDVAITTIAENHAALQSRFNKVMDVLTSFSIKKGLLLEKSKTSVSIFGKKHDSDKIIYEGKQVPEAHIFRHLGLRLTAEPDKISYDAHWKYIKGRFGSAARQTNALFSLSYKKLLANKVRSTAYGVYLHGADVSPIPGPNFLRPLQNIYCKILSKIFHEKFEGIDHPSQRAILKEAGHPSLFNAHIQAKISRISSILFTGKPKNLRKWIVKSLYFGDENGNFLKPFVDRSEKLRAWNKHVKLINWRNESKMMHKLSLESLDYTKLDFSDMIYQRSLESGLIYLWMRYPHAELKNCKKTILRNIFPFNAIKHFNGLPAALRKQIGLKNFNQQLKLHISLKCHHRFSTENNNFCRYCIPGGILDNERLGNIVPSELSTKSSNLEARVKAEMMTFLDENCVKFAKIPNYDSSNLNAALLDLGKVILAKNGGKPDSSMHNNQFKDRLFGTDVIPSEMKKRVSNSVSKSSYKNVIEKYQSRLAAIQES